MLGQPFSTANAEKGYKETIKNRDNDKSYTYLIQLYSYISKIKSRLVSNWHDVIVVARQSEVITFDDRRMSANSCIRN